MILKRVLETETMDTLEEALDYDEMDHAEVNRIFVDDLLACGKIEGEVLDLGTGPARIPLHLCHRIEEVRVCAVELAVNMLDIARNNVEVEGLTDRILLDRVDAKKLPYENQRFDVVMSNSLVHHIPDPQVVLVEITRVARPGGLVFVRDLLRPEDNFEVRRLVEQHAGDQSAHAREMFADSLRAALELTEIRELIQRLGIEPATVQQTSDRHWTWTFNLPMPVGGS